MILSNQMKKGEDILSLKLWSKGHRKVEGRYESFFDNDGGDRNVVRFSTSGSE